MLSPEFISWLFHKIFGVCRGSIDRTSAGKNKDTEKEEKTRRRQPGEMEPNTMLATICGARGLYMKNKPSLEAFVTVTMQGKGSLRSRAATEAVHTEGDCRWDEVCEFKLNDKFNSVAVAVHSKTKLGSGELIGKCELDLEQAKQLGGNPNWLRLKKKNSDEKYRGEVQMKFEFSYEKPSLSVSNTDLHQMVGGSSGGGGGGLMSKMKKKIKLAKNGHKQAEDTTSMASAWSAVSTKSTRSARFFGKIGKTLGIKEKEVNGAKSATLPVGTFLTPHDNHLETSNGMYETCNSGGAGTLGTNATNSRNNSSFNVFDALPNRPPSLPAASPQPPLHNLNKYQTMPHAMTSPAGMISNDSFRRTGSIRSMASSGFGSSKHQQQKIDPNNSQDLLAVIDSLKLELQVKESRMKDMENYMDNLISRVMERNPELLAKPSKENMNPLSKLRFF